MQNKPNFQTNRKTLTLVKERTYNDITSVNQKITNPIKPNTNPIGKPPKTNANFCHYRDLQRKTNFAPKNNKPKRTQSQPNTNPNQTQTKPNSTPAAKKRFQEYQKLKEEARRIPTSRSAGTGRHYRPGENIAFDSLIAKVLAITEIGRLDTPAIFCKAA